MRRIFITGLLSLLLLATPLVIEILAGEESFGPVGLALDILELFIFAATIAAVSLLTMETRNIKRDQGLLFQNLNETHAENMEWRKASKAQIDGFRGAVQNQFDEWELTKAEQDITSLILKGCSHKQIAEIRRSTVATVRQQAQSIYKKSKLKNRSELAAYFLDAILEPGPMANGSNGLPQS
jgi:DNA-binding CsgD family transcriptional regulator